MTTNGSSGKQEWELICKSLQRGQLTGSPRFVDEIDKKIEGGWNSAGREDREKWKKSVPFVQS